MLRPTEPFLMLKRHEGAFSRLVVLHSCFVVLVGLPGFVAAEQRLASPSMLQVSSSENPLRSNTGPSIDDQALVEALDDAMRASWKAAGITPSKRAPDGAWARRVYLDLVGRVPTVEELDRYFAIDSKERRAWLVDELLGSAYLEERSGARATEWANLLIGRTGGQQNNSPIHRESFLDYLYGAFSENRSYDQFMTELVTATGSVRPEDDDHNGASNYLADKMGENGVQATAKTSKVFLGVAVQCTQCHNHPFNEQKQNQFWELNAFFRQTRVERIRDEETRRRYGRILEFDFRGEGPRRATVGGAYDRAETYYELRNGRLSAAYPVFLDGTSLEEIYEDRGEGYGDSGRLSDVNRREELAKLIAESPEFSIAAVNREWGRLLGYGFTNPVDDMGPHNPPTHPEVLQMLADAFRDSGHDHQRLTRWIVLSEAYGLDSRAGRSNEEDDPALGATPLFSRFYLRQLTAEQVYDSLLTATRADAALSEEARERAKARWLRQFSTAFGNDENGESNNFNGSIPQVLAMMNSQLMRQATSIDWEAAWSNDRGSQGKYGEANQAFLSEVATDTELSNADRVERLYLAALARKPDRNELKMCNTMLAAREGNASEALRDIWWALLNSNEFILQH